MPLQWLSIRLKRKWKKSPRLPRNFVAGDPYCKNLRREKNDQKSNAISRLRSRISSGKKPVRTVARVWRTDPKLGANRQAVPYRAPWSIIQSFLSWRGVWAWDHTARLSTDWNEAKWKQFEATFSQPSIWRITFMLIMCHTSAWGWHLKACARLWIGLYVGARDTGSQTGILLSNTVRQKCHPRV